MRTGVLVKRKLEKPKHTQFFSCHIFLHAVGAVWHVLLLLTVTAATAAGAAKELD